MAAIRHEPALDVSRPRSGAKAFISYREGPRKVFDFDIPRAERGPRRRDRVTVGGPALPYARDGGYKVVPSCPFVAVYIERHAEFRDLLA